MYVIFYDSYYSWSNFVMRQTMLSADYGYLEIFYTVVTKNNSFNLQKKRNASMIIMVSFCVYLLQKYYHVVRSR